MAKYEIPGAGVYDFPDDATPDEINDFAQSVVEAKSAISPESTGQYIARQAGLTTRAAVNPITAGMATGAAIGSIAPGVGTAAGAGAGALAGLITDIVPRVYNALIAEPTKTGKIPSLGEVMDRMKDEVGLPRPVTDIEKMAGRAIEATTGLAAPVAAGGMALKSASPIAQRIGQILTQDTGMQGLSTLAGSVASSLAEQQGAGPIGQTAAGMIGALAPSAAPLAGAGIRAAGRAGATQEEIRRNIESFAGAGTTPTAGQATQKGFIQGMESTMGRIPGAAGVIREKGMAQQAEVGQRVKQIAEQLSTVKEPTIAGAGIQRGVEDVFIPRARAIESGLYNKLDTSIPKFQPVKAANTYSTLEELTRPIEGAPALSRNQMITSQEIASLKNDLESDLLNAQGDIPFSALKGLRSKIGEKLSSVNLLSNIPQGVYKRIYGAISRDLEEAAAQAGPKALNELKRANNYTRSLHQRMEKLQGFIDKNEPEKIYRSAFEGAELGATRIRAVMQSLPKQEQKAVAASFISKMGKALPGQQDELGDMFSTNRFLTNWNKLSPEAKNVLFNRFGSDYRKDMDKIAETASRIRESAKVLSNPAGTTATSIQPASLAVLATSAVAGQYKLVGSLLGLSAISRASAKAFTNPRYVRWLAENSNIPSSGIPGAIADLSAIAREDKDESLDEIAKVLKKQEIQKRLSR